MGKLPGRNKKNSNVNARFANIRLNSHYKNVSNAKRMPACVRFTKNGHSIIEQAKFITINRNGKYYQSYLKSLIKTNRGFLDIKTKYFDSQRSKPITL